jgi:hypothetical protein
MERYWQQDLCPILRYSRTTRAQGAFTVLFSKHRAYLLAYQRTERATREGENSPARITIAQAALLNLHGQELRSQAAAALPTRSPLPALSLDRRVNINRPQPEHARFPEYSSNAYVPAPAFTVDYSLAPGRQPPRTQTPTHTSPYHHHAPLPSEARTQSMDPTMAALLESLRGNGAPFQATNAYTGGQGAYQDHSHHILANRGSIHIPAEMEYGMGYGQATTTQTRSGYTATEEFIMRAHADSNAQRRRPAPLDLVRRRRDSDASVNIGMGVRGYRAQASSVSVPQQHPFSPTSLMEQPLSPMDENEFHAITARNSEYRQALMQPTAPKHSSSSNTSKIHHRSFHRPILICTTISKRTCALPRFPIARLPQQTSTSISVTTSTAA